MLTLLSHTVGGPETLVLEDRPDPVPAAGELLLRVKACGVNFPDTLIIEDKYQFKPERPFAPGGEVSGVVEALGDGVTAFQPGDRVLAFTGWGGMAQKLVLPASRCMKLPDEMPFDVAAAFVMAYGTSLHALKDRAQLQAGETLLVLGAAGGVGLAAVELGKAAGARVVAAVSSADKAALARDHGADHTVMYPSGPFDKDGLKALGSLFKDACGNAGPHVVCDPVGGDYAEAALRAIHWEGRYLVIGFPAGIPKLPLNLTLLKGCQVIGVFWGAAVQRHPDQHAANMQELLGLYRQGTIRPVISARFPLQQGGDAIRLLASRRALGKVVVTVD